MVDMTYDPGFHEAIRRAACAGDWSWHYEPVDQDTEVSRRLIESALNEEESNRDG